MTTIAIAGRIERAIDLLEAGATGTALATLRALAISMRAGFAAEPAGAQEDYAIALLNAMPPGSEITLHRDAKA